jgi:malonyl CoA-acyl carrier protein transacylase
MLVCSDREDTLAALKSRAPERLLTRRQESVPPTTTWLLPGQGSQHSGMGRDLYETEPVFRREIDACAELLATRLGRDLRALLFTTSGPELAETRFAQPALFAVEHALARLWLSWGLRPQALIGHSLGEYVAACLAGVLSIEDALTLVAARGELMQELPPGAMLSVDLSEAKALAEIAAAPGLSLAAVNSPGQCVISGPAREIDALANRLEKRTISCRRLHTSHAFHSEMMEPILGRFADLVARIELHPPAIPYLSNLTGTWITAGEAMDPGYWTRHLRATVRFADGIFRLLADLPAGTVLLEVGPGRTLSRLVRSQAVGRTVLASLPQADSQESGPAALLHTLGRLWLLGVEIDWPAFQGEERRRRIPLPTYPFQRRRHWVEPGRAGLAGAGAPVALILPEGAAEDPAWASALAAQGFRVVTVPPDQARPENLRALLGAPETSSLETTPAEEQPVSGHARPGIDTPYEAPQTEIERRLAAIWGDLLGIDQVGVHDDLFDLGGDSMTATRLVWRVREAFRVEIPLESVFSASTIACFAPLLTTGVEERPILEVPPIGPVPRQGDIPLSFAQQQIWVDQQLNLSSPAYNMNLAFRLLGPLDPAVIAWSLSQMVARHEVLRTTYPAPEGWPIQRIASPGDVPLPLVDLAGLEDAQAWAEMLAYIARSSSIPFDLVRGPLLRAALLRLEPTDHIFCVNMHHIGFDAWSWDILFSELAIHYEAGRAGRPSPLPPLAIQCADFAIWQRRHAADLAGHLEWWKERLAGLVPLQLAPDRPPGAGELTGSLEELWLPTLLADALRALGRAEDCSIFMVLLALFKVLLHHRTGREDISVGSVVAGRLTAELEGMIGNFINTFLLRTSLEGDPSFREILARVKETTLGAHAHQEIPYEQVVAALHEGKDRRTRLFQVWFVVHIHTKPASSRSLGGDLVASVLQGDRPALRHDLSFSLWPTADGIGVDIEYRSDLFTRSAIRQMAEDYTTLAQAVVSDADLRCSALADRLTQAHQERQGTRKELAKAAGLEKLRAKRREAV